MGESDAVRRHHPIWKPGSRVSLEVAQTRRQNSIGTKKLLADAPMEELMLNATID
jgi:hypothetical protein